MRIKNRFNPRAETLAIAIIAITLIGILALTLFPYDFFIAETIADFTWAGLRARAHRPLLMPLEFIANIVMFVPLGFGLALRFYKKTIAAALLVVFLSLLATLTVEFLQIFLPSRTPSHTDLISNTLGGTIGFILWRYWQPLIKSQWFCQIKQTSKVAYSALLKPVLPYWQIIRPRPRTQRRIVAIALCSYGCFTLWGTHSLKTANAWSLSNWDPTYPLLLGNELEGDRPWNGQISDVQIYDQQLAPAEIQQLLDRPSTPIESATPIAHYPLSGTSPYTDQTSHQPALVWQGNAPPRSSITSPSTTFTPQHWLETQSPPSQLIEQLKAAKAFTISLTATTNSKQQTGPARILSLSQGPLHRNLTIGQAGSHLSLRLRTPITKENGQRPEFSVPNVFSVAKPHHLILSYSANQLAFYIDTINNRQKLQFSPEMTLFWQLAPPVLSTIQLNGATSLICQLLYRALWLLPIGLIMLFSTNLSSKNKSDNRQFQILIVAMATLFYGLLEGLLQ